MPRSLETSLSTLIEDPTGRELLASMDIATVARRLLAEDGYRDGVKMREAAQLVNANLEDWYHHRLWCAKREALGDRADALTLTMTGDTYRNETLGRPTVLVAPMTLPMADALSVVNTLAEQREAIVFGHEVFADDVPQPRIDVADPRRGRVRQQIESTLDRGGIYCTYADFAYRDVSTQQVCLFGRARAMSTGWLRLAARHGTMLLPAVCRRVTDTEVRVEYAEAIQIESPTTTPDLDAVAEIAIEMLEDLIRSAPEQWLLLPTLAFESPEMART